MNRQEILVVEEKRQVIEYQIKEELYNWRADVRPNVLGKFDAPDDSGGEWSRPNGVSIFFPPANGFAGSVVWQLAQSAASVNALPRAMVSAEGSACAWPKPNAVHKSRIARIARIARYGPCAD